MGNKPSIPKHTRYIESDENIVVLNVEFEIKQTGLGVISKQFIPANTIIRKLDLFGDELYDKINDLNYTGDANKYLSNVDSEDKTNVGIVKVGNEMEIFELPKVIYLETLRDIESGEELSRFYNEDFWFEKEFNNKYGQVIKSGDLPEVYTYVDSFRETIHSSNVLQIYGKKIEDKYYYVQLMGNTKINFYHKVNQFNELNIFANLIELEDYLDKKYGPESFRSVEHQQEVLKLVYLIDRTKSDYSKYEPEDYIQIDNSKYYSVSNLNSRPKKYFSSNKELVEAYKTATEEEKQMYSWEIKRETISLE